MLVRFLHAAEQTELTQSATAMTPSQATLPQNTFLFPVRSIPPMSNYIKILIL